MTDFAFTYSATDTQLRNLYEQKKNVVWEVVVEHPNGVSCGSAFALNEKGLLMTCAHIFKADYDRCTVTVCGWNEEYERNAEVLEFNREWDMVLLQVKEVNNDKYNYATLSDDGELSVDQMLVHIGHPRSLLYSYLVGKTAYKCIKSPPIPRGNTISLEQYDDITEAPAPQRGYRVLGDLYPRSYTKYLRTDETNEEDDKYVDVQDYRLPIVQIYNLGCKAGSSGGPIFDGRGDVVGMLLLGSGSSSIAAHVSVLKVFLDKWKRKVAHQKKRKRRKISSAAGLEAQQHNRN